MKIEEISLNNRPRERAMAFGLKSLSNCELLALFIRSGYKGCSAIDIANEILSKYTFNDLCKISINQLSKIKGISKTKAIEILATFEIGRRLSEENIYNKDIFCEKESLDKYLINNLGHLDQEHVLGIYLDLHNRVIDIKTLFIGTIDSATFNTREIIKRALEVNATKVILAHNHPSNGAYASKQDIIVTNELIKIAMAMNVMVIDHLVVTKDKVVSILNNNWI